MQELQRIKARRTALHQEVGARADGVLGQCYRDICYLADEVDRLRKEIEVLQERNDLFRWITDPTEWLVDAGFATR